ncbi:ABC transporter ATP-binding protein [Pasteuria penetrans]|uniref:ABC transporter ATP-binding protein n=1 Tax=Pasteuria penetrans TaxID=86005 RepID=UPI000F996009|nr:ABC transporter ATP-binding protein [Pasteuria penetrans]
MLSIQNLSFCYENGKRGEESGGLVLNDISFGMDKGDIVALLGPSGCGKSTLFYILGGLYAPTKGSIYLQGRSFIREPGRIGYLSPQPSLFPWKTVYDNIAMGRLSQKPNPATDSPSVEELLAVIGLTDYAREYPKALSMGMQQRVALARALYGGHALLCLDEPFSSLDNLKKKELLVWLRGLLKERHTTTLVVTHSTEEAAILADEVHCLTPRPSKIFESLLVPLQDMERFDSSKSLKRLQWQAKVENLFAGYSEHRDVTS